MADTFNITIKCESEEERDNLLESLDLSKLKNPKCFILKTMVDILKMRKEKLSNGQERRTKEYYELY